MHNRCKELEEDNGNANWEENASSNKVALESKEKVLVKRIREATRMTKEK